MSKPDAERRSVVLPVEARAKDGKTTIAGYAAVFDQETDIGGMFREKVARGAFADTLKSADVRAYYDHDMGRVLGRSSSGTLRLHEDDTGLAVEIDLPDTSDGRDVRTLIERGDISGMSFGFIVTGQEWDEKSEPPLRTISNVDLIEVSVVSIPAYEGTSVALRSLHGAQADARAHNFEQARERLARKVSLDLRSREIRSKA